MQLTLRYRNMSSHTRCLFKNAIVTTLSATLLLTGTLINAHADGWQKLYGNKINAARTDFKQTLNANPKDIDALRGLGWTYYYSDDKAHAFDCWNKYIVLKPSDKYALDIWLLLINLASTCNKYDQLAATAKIINDSPETSPQMKSAAIKVIALNMELHGNTKQADEVRKSLHYITDWYIAGPFENICKSGFDKPAGPELGGKITDTYYGKDHINTKWYKCAHNQNGICKIELADRSDYECVYYAVTSIQSENDQNVCLYYTPYGASKIYLNGACLFSDNTYRTSEELQPDLFRIKASLKKGQNTILIKIADDGKFNRSFSLRIFKASATPPNKPNGIISETNQPANISGINPQNAELVPITQTTQVVNSENINIDKNTPIEALVCEENHAYLNNDIDRCIDILKQAIVFHPDCAVLHWELCQALSKDNQIDECKLELQKTLSFSKEIAGAELYNVTQHSESVNTSVTIKALKSLLIRFPNSDSISQSIATNYSSEKLYSDAIAAIQRTYKLNPNSDSLSDYSDILREAGISKKAYINLILTQLKLTPNHIPILELYADELATKEDYQAAIKIYEKLHILRPATTSYITQLSDLYHTVGSINKAIMYMQQVVEILPQDADSIASLGSLLLESGKKAKAIEAYNKAIAINPSQVYLRDKVQLLLGLKPVSDLVPALPTPNLTKWQGEPKSGAPPFNVLLDECREVIYPDYTSQDIIHEVIKVNDKTAADYCQRYPLDRPIATSTITVENARLIKADGKIEDRTDSVGADESEVTFPSIAPGDIIDVTYRVEAYNRGALAKSFCRAWVFADADQKVEVSRFVLITPQNMDYQYVNHNNAPIPTINTKGTWKIAKWEISNIFVKNEVLAPNTYHIAPWVDISSIKSWAEIVKWYEDLALPRCRPDNYIKAKALELTKNANSEDDKIKSLTGYVANNIQYQTTPFRLSAYIPTEGKKVIKERYGDCKDKAALLTAMLNVIGIKAHMVLINTRQSGTISFLPSPRFNHAITCVETSNGPLWIDGTAEDFPFKDLPSSDEGVKALEITDNTTDLTTSPILPVEKNNGNSTFDLKLDAKGNAVGNITLSMAGQIGWQIRSAMKRVSADKQNLVLSYLTTKLTTLDFDSGSIENIDNNDKPILITLKCHKNNYGSIAGNFLICDLPVKSSSETDLSSICGKDRVWGANWFLYRHVENLNMNFELPEGYTSQDLPEQVTKSSPWGTYTASYKQQDKTLHIDVTNSIDADEIQRIDLDQFVAFNKSFTDELNRKIVLKK